MATSTHQSAARLRLNELRNSYGPSPSVPRNGRVSFGESPICRSQSTGKTSDTSPQQKRKSAGSIVSESLTKLQTERWALMDQIKGLESQVSTRDSLLRDNEKLRSELAASTQELGVLKGKSAEMTEKLDEYFSKERLERRSMESLIHSTKHQLDEVVQERDHLNQENSKLQNEVLTLRDELFKLKSSFTSSVDRGLHERQLSDMQTENHQLRTLLDDSIPKAMFSRLEAQLTEKLGLVSSTNGQLKELQLSNTKLLSELRQSEELIAEKETLITSLQSSLGIARQEFNQLKVEVEDILDQKEEDQRQFKLAAEKEMNANKIALEIATDKISTLESQLMDTKGQYQSFQHDQEARANALHSIRGMFRKQVEIVKTDLERLRSQVLQEKRSLSNSLMNSLDQVATQHTLMIATASKEINAVLNVAGIYGVVSGNSVGSIEGALSVLRDYIIDLQQKLKRTKFEFREQETAIEDVKAKATEKDKLIEGLFLRLSRQERDKRSENVAMAKLRDSIESAERSLCQHRKSNENGSSFVRTAGLDQSRFGNPTG